MTAIEKRIEELTKELESLVETHSSLTNQINQLVQTIIKKNGAIEELKKLLKPKSDDEK